jgi:SAM-dependent methyltransferase
MNKKTSWGAVAEWYDDLIGGGKDTYQKNVLMPNLIRIVDPKPGMKIFDVACGQGYFSHAFADHGANVIGCDISPELIELAKKGNTEAGDLKKSKYKLPEFFAASADSFFNSSGEISTNSVKPDSADAVVIVLALQNIENLAGTVAECAKALKQGGRFVFVLNHPAFRIPQSSSWQWEEGDDGSAHSIKEYRRIDSYMSDKTLKIDMTPGEENQYKKKFTMSFHRPLQSYFKSLNKAGFAVTRLEEWISHKKSQAGPRAAEEDRMRKEIPMFLCVESVKL